MPKQIKDMRSQDRRRVVMALKALSNQNRLAIFEEIRAGGCRGQLDAHNRLSVSTVAERFSISLSTVSHHIKELKAAELISCERKGQTIL